MTGNFDDKDRYLLHEARRLWEDFFGRHRLEFDGPALAVHGEMVQLLHWWDCQVEGGMHDLAHVSAHEAWFMGETAKVEHGRIGENPFPAGSDKHAAWKCGFLGIPQEWPTRRSA